MGKNPADRLKTLLGKLDSVRAGKEGGSTISNHSRQLFHKFVEQLENNLENLPNPLEWRYFYLRDLPILLDINEEVREVSNQNHLNRAQTSALKKLKDVSPEEFKRVTAEVEVSSAIAIKSDSKKSAQIDQ